MTVLAEFILARIAEDEAVAARAERAAWTLTPDRRYNKWALRGGNGYGDVCVDAQRIAAECEAKRKIVENLQPWGPWDDLAADDVLKALASVYRDHPDYREVVGDSAGQ